MSFVIFYNEENVIGESINGSDFDFIPITKIPILILKQGKKSWAELLKRAKRNKLKYIVFTKEGQSTTSYGGYVKRVTGKKLEEVEVVGFGVFGQDELVTNFSGDLALLR